MTNYKEDDVSFYGLFFPLTTKKAIVFIFLIGVFVFFNALFNQFVWDDLSYIQFNPDVHTMNIPFLFKQNSFNDPNGQYRALTATYFSILYALFHNTVFFYHTIQVLLHIGNTILLFLLFRKFFTLSLSFFLSLVFLVHPIQVESVSFIGAAGNVLVFLFGILPLYLLEKESLREKYLFLGSSFFLLLLSLLCKETGIVFLFLASAMPFIFHWKKKVLFVFLSFITLALYLCIRFFIGGIFYTSDALQSVIPITNLSLFERVIHIPAIFFFYLKTFVFPTSLVIDQLWILSAIDIAQFYAPLFFVGLFFLSCLGLGVVVYKNQRKIFPSFMFFALWFFLGIGMHLQIIPLDMTVADRWFYVPIAGLLGIVGIGIELVNSKRFSRAFLILAVVLIVLLSIRTMMRNTNWVDNLTLFSHDAALLDNFEMENNLATFYYLDGKPKEAIMHAKRSVDLYPNETNLTNIGFLYENKKDYKKAEEYYTKAINIKRKTINYDKRSAFAYLRLGGIYLFQGNPKKAIETYEKATTDHPRDEVLWSFLAASYYEQGDQEKALAAAKKAKELRPTASIQNLYNLILKKEKFDIRKL